MTLPQIRIGRHKFHVLFPDLFRPLAPAEYEGLRQDIVNRKVQVPIVVDDEMGIIDGSNRAAIVSDLKLKDIPIEIYPDLSLESKRALAIALNVHRRHLTIEQLQELRAKRMERVAEGRQEGKSIRQISREEGISRTQVHNDIKDQGVQGWTPESGATSGVQGWTPESGATSGVQGWTPESGATSGVQGWTPESGATSGVQGWTPGSGATSGVTGVTPGTGEPRITGRDGKKYPARRKTRGPERVVNDALGRPIPPRLLDVFNDRFLSDSIRALDRILRQSESAEHWKDHPLVEEVRAKLRDARALLSDGLPWAVCDSCGGAACARCRHSGYLARRKENQQQPNRVA